MTTSQLWLGEANASEILRISLAVNNPPFNIVETDPAKIAEQIEKFDVTMIYNNDDIIGFTVCQDLMDNHVRIAEFQIDPAYQGRGLGKESFACLVYELEKNGFTMISLETHPTNERALRTYRGKGFRVVCRKDNFPVPGTERDVLVLQL